MRKILPTFLSLFLFFACVSWDSGDTKASEPDYATKVKIEESYGNLPLAFIKNRGQVDNRVAYYLKGRQGTIYFTKEGIVYDLTKGEARSQKSELRSRAPGVGENCEQFSRLSFTLKFVGAKRDVKISASEKLPGKVNYLTGNDPQEWQKYIPIYKEIIYQDLYNDIDLKIYGTNNQMEYDFIVHPGGSPKDIQVAFEGIGGLEIDEEGNLLIETAFFDVKHLKPYIYQKINGKLDLIEGSFKVAKNTFTFEINEYDCNYPLIIDPLTLSYSTYLGGSNDDVGTGIAIDSSGNAYVAGYTRSTNFPLQNAYQGTYGGATDAFITKLNLSGSGLIYSTYLGGSNVDVGTNIAIDSSGNAYVAGYTESTNFPLQNAYQGTKRGGTDAFVTKLNPSGSGLIYSTYLGGSNDNAGYGIAIDSSGNAYIIGCTNSTNFPLQNAYQGIHGGGYDAFVTKLNPSGTGLIYSTYLGGNDRDYGTDIAIDSSGNAYIAGHTYSTNFPLQNAYQGTYGGGTYDAFVTKLNPSGSGLIYSTYLGRSNDDMGTGIAIDSSGNAYIAGYTGSTNFPLQNAYQGTFGGGTYDAFVTKLNPSGSGLIYSTYLGRSNDDMGTGIAIDSSGNAYITGHTNSTNFPLQNAYQGTFGGGYDAFVTKLNSSGSGLIYSTYLGGSNDDQGRSIVIDSSGNAYITGHTNSTNFPLQNAYQGTFGGGYDAFVTKLTYSCLAPTANFSASPTSGNKPLTVQFTDQSTNSPTSWSWNFGDGGTSTSQNPSYTYNSASTYTVTLTATNSCGSDSETKTNYITVTQPCVAPVAAFTASPTSGNKPLTVQFTDQSPNSPTSWSWNFGDGGTSTSQNPSHTYNNAGNYTVSLTATNSCGSDSETKTNHTTVICNAPTANFSASPTSGNRPLTVYFSDLSTNSPTSWSWNFGDGGTSTSQNPSHTYNSAGTYTLTLTATNSCGSNTATKTNYITVSESLDANFTALPTSGSVPLTVYFLDQSTGTISSWQWNFGDDGTSTTQNPTHTYTQVGQYTVTLTVTGPAGTNTETKSNYITVSDLPPSTITCAIAPNTITLGNQVTVTGTITPASSAIVTVTFRAPSGALINQTALSDTNGAFRLNYSPDSAGQWTATATWQGDAHYGGDSSDLVPFTVNKATTTITCNLSQQAIKIGDGIDISGKLTPYPDPGFNLAGLPIEIIITTPNNFSLTKDTTTNDQYGHYKIEDYEAFIMEGTWKVQARFPGNSSYESCLSDEKEVTVSSSAGYAILVQGKITSQSGLESHNKTCNHIYSKLRDRGFIDDEIYYLNYNSSQSGVDGTPSESNLNYAITTWAKDQMNTTPGPLFIILVDHGSSGKFYLAPDELTVTEFAAMLDTLESNLNSQAGSQKIIIIYGACFSGSFISGMSNSNRIIVTSAAADEQSYKGPKDTDGIRDGEYFLSQFFREAGRGESLKEGFMLATERTERFTGSGSLRSANNAKGYYDSSAQHPLLDDNGDGRGTNDLTLAGEDGDTAAEFYLGYSTNAADPVEVINVTPATTVGSGTSLLTATTLWAQVNDNSRLDTIWLEVKPPNYAPAGSQSTEQEEMDLSSEVYDRYNSSLDRYEWTYDGFTQPGTYEVYYFAKDTETGDISPLKKTEVYVEQSGSEAPGAFSLISPANGFEVNSPVLALEWGKSTDPDGDQVTYTVEIAEDENFSSVKYQAESIAETSLALTEDADLDDNSTYYWRVTATDPYGSQTECTRVFSFTTNFTNVALGLITGHITRAGSGSLIEDAEINTGIGAYLAPGGYYVIDTPEGIYEVKARAPACLGARKQNVRVTSGEACTVNFQLNPLPRDISIKKIETTAQGPVFVGTPVQFTAQAGSSSTPIYYQFWVASKYGTPSYGNWTIIQQYSAANSCTWTPSQEGNYVVVAWVKDNPGSNEYHQVGMSLKTANASSNPVQVRKLNSTITYPVVVGTPISFTTEASGGNGPVKYQYWVTDPDGIAGRPFNPTPPTAPAPGLPMSREVISLWFGPVTLSPRKTRP